MRKVLVFVLAFCLIPQLVARAADEAPAFIRWLDDDHWLMSRDGWTYKVAAATAVEVKQQRLDQTTDDASKHQSIRLFPGPSPWQVINQQSMAGEIKGDSPDNQWTAVVRKNDLYLIDKATKSERRVTKDGSDLIFNGRADWVYHEEILMPPRSQKTFYWSADSAHLTFLRLDDTSVDKFTLVNSTQRQPTPEIATYPKVGRPNPIVKIGIAHVADQPVTWVDLSVYDSKDLLIARLGWHPNNKQVYFYAQNRIQTWLDLCVADVATGKCTKLFRDQTKAWIFDYGAIGPVHFLKDGAFLWFSQRSGNKHLYRYAADGKLMNPVTSGNWDVSSLTKVDEAEGVVTFKCDKDAWLGSVPFRVKLDGTDLEPMLKNKAAGTHDVHFSPGGKYFVDEWSDFTTAPQLVLHQANGKPLRTIGAHVGQDSDLVRLGRQDPAPVRPRPQAQPKKLGGAEFVTIKTPDGVTLAATVQLPPNFDPQKKYPVWYSGYGGPHMPSIRNTFGGKAGGDPGKAAQGYIVFHADPRSSSNTAHLSWACYKQLGVQELKDIETALRWLLDTYPAADPKRIGISGHSYGGYMAAYALTHSKMFAAGIAGAPPTDWLNYDSIYTERYMALPEDNPKGYQASSVLAAAKNLHGKLLLLHGMMDDNVHMTNTIQLADAFQKANVDFEMMLYPHARHGIFSAHSQRLQNEFMKRVLRPGAE